MKKVAAFIILAFLSFTTISAADAPPASLHLELGKDTLAVAEPVYLKATIANNMNKDLIINLGYMFDIQNSSVFSLFLITPTGEEWPFVGRRGSVRIIYSPTDPLYFLLPPNEHVTEGYFLYWTFIVPPEYQDALQKLPSGNYKMFATYTLSGPEEVKYFTIYSDTIEFTFLPLRYEHLHAIIQMDSLRSVLYWRVSGAKGRLIWESLSKSPTPYREAAWAQLISLNSNPKEFKKEKALFDEAYPESQFSTYLLTRQFRWARMGNRTAEADSLLNLLEQDTPSLDVVLGMKSKIKLITAKERSER